MFKFFGNGFPSLILPFKSQFHFRFCALSLIVQKLFQCNLSWKESLFNLSVSTVNSHQFVQLPPKRYLNSRTPVYFSIEKKNEIEQISPLALPHPYFIALKVTLGKGSTTPVTEKFR